MSLVKLRYPSLRNFAKKLSEEEGNSDSQLVSCKYWDKTVGMLMVGISGNLCSNQSENRCMENGGVDILFPSIDISSRVSA